MTTELIVVGGDPVRGRSCGSCRACCTQVPVDLPLARKKANERCCHLRSKGCGIYPTRPAACREWDCRWLFDTDTAELARPDKSGIVIDCMIWVIVLAGHTGHAFQIWCDPKRPDAHRDPALRRYLALLGERHMLPTIVRWNEGDALTLLPPAMTTNGEWVEIKGILTSTEMMRLAEVKFDQ